MGKVIRFATRDNKGKQSGVYRLWSSNGKSDVYIAIRALGGEIKTSLHESGECQFSFTSNFIKDKEVHNRYRHIKKWTRTDNLQLGLSLAFRIVIPSSEMVSNSSISKKVIWINNNEDDTCVEIAILFSDEKVNIYDWPGKTSMNTKLIDSIKLPNGETVWIVYYMRSMENEMEQLKDLKEKAYEMLTEEAKSIPYLRGFFFDVENDNSGKYIDFVLNKK